jgi:hypothetical protein
VDLDGPISERIIRMTAGLLDRPPEAGDDGSECGAVGGLNSQHRH